MTAHQGIPSFRLLFVCTGNVCRSPLAEVLTRHLLSEQLGDTTAAHFEVSSAGTHALIGSPLFPLASAEAARLGVEHAATAGRQLDHRAVRGTDLVLGASPEHRSAVLEDFPELVTRTFTLREFARLAASVPPDILPDHPLERVRALVPLAHRRRGRIPLADDRIPDPAGGPPEAYRLATDLIEESLRAVLGVLRPQAAHPPSPDA